MTRIEFNTARLAQYGERTRQTASEVITQIMKTYGRECNQQAVNDLIDPVVDEAYRSDKVPVH